MTQLKDMIENLINENFDNAKVDFHSYLSEKMKEQKGTVVKASKTKDTE